MTSFKSDCIAFLIDADNVSADVIQQAFELVQMRHRLVHIRRAHCTAEAAVKHLELFKHLSIRPIVNMVTGKNCTDIALAVDAMEMAIIEKPDVVYIVSSDSDFAPLVIRLREKGCRVEGIGQKGKTGGASVGVYDDFVDIEHRKSPSHAPHAGHATSGRSAPAKRSRRGGGGRNDPAMPNAAPRRESPRDAPVPARNEPRADARRDRQPPSRPMPRFEPMEELPVELDVPAVLETPSLPEDPAPQIQLPLPTEPVVDDGVVEGPPPVAAKRGSRAKAPAKSAGRAPAKTPAAKRPRAAAKTVAVAEEAAVEPQVAAPPPPAPRPPPPAPQPTPPAPVTPPAFVMPDLVPIPGLPDEVAYILAVVPRLRDGETVELSVAGERLRAAGLLAKSASSTRLFGKYRDHFLLTPNGQPNKVRFRPPASEE